MGGQAKGSLPCSIQLCSPACQVQLAWCQRHFGVVRQGKCDARFRHSHVHCALPLGGGGIAQAGSRSPLRQLTHPTMLKRSREEAGLAGR